MNQISFEIAKIKFRSNITFNNSLNPKKLYKDRKRIKVFNKNCYLNSESILKRCLNPFNVTDN